MLSRGSWLHRAFRRRRERAHREREDQLQRKCDLKKKMYDAIIDSGKPTKTVSWTTMLVPYMGFTLIEGPTLAPGGEARGPCFYNLASFPTVGRHQTLPLPDRSIKDMVCRYMEARVLDIWPQSTNQVHFFPLSNPCVLAMHLKTQTYPYARQVPESNGSNCSSREPIDWCCSSKALAVEKVGESGVGVMAKLIGS
jgi:hypothetical protein